MTQHEILGEYSRLQAYIHNHRIVTDQSCGSIVIINKSGSDIAWLYVRWTMGVITTHNIEVHWLVSASVKILIIFTHTCIIENTK